VDIVYGIEVLERCLTRMETMVEIMEEPPGERRSAAIRRLLTRLASFAYQDRRLSHLIKWNLHLLNWKIVERSGSAGEHYIALDRKEYWHIWRAAAGGGLLTTLTAAGKIAILATPLALFQEGFAAGLNYAVSFLLLQAFGLMLATKQPAMTAAALGKIAHTHRGRGLIDALVEYTIRICHSQFAAALANVFVVSIGCFLFDQLWRLIAGHPYMRFEEAQHIFETLSPSTAERCSTQR